MVEAHAQGTDRHRKRQQNSLMVPRDRAAALSSEALGTDKAEDFLCSVSTWTVAVWQPQKGNVLQSGNIMDRSQAKGKEAPYVPMAGLMRRLRWSCGMR